MTQAAGHREDFARALLRRAFDACVATAQPETFLPRFTPTAPKGRTFVIGAGKGSAAMAAAFEQAWRGGPLSGLVVTRYGHGAPTRAIEIVEAAHPVPDAAGFLATQRLIGALQNLAPDDLIVALMSGGGSSLLCAPAPGVSLADKQAVNRALLASGAPIADINILRKHLSRIKGGRLPQFAPATAIKALIVSDVPGDDLSAIASGPTVADASTLAQARDIVARWRLALPASALAALRDEANETPKAVSPLVDNELVMNPAQALAAAKAALDKAGCETVLLGEALEGEARDLGRIYGAMLRACFGKPHPICLLSGGETSVTLSGGAHPGRGGRNSEYLLSAALSLQNEDRCFGLAADTDGIDGSEDNAGAFFSPQTLQRAARAGLDPRDALAKHDSYAVFAIAGDLTMTGPTRTNVNDFRALLYLP